MKIENWHFEGDNLAVMPESLQDIISKREMAIIDGVDVEDAINRRATKFKNVSGKVVTIPLHGFISHKATIWSALGFETSSETFGMWMDSLVNNGDVGAIVIDVDSPGGTALGLSGVSDKIFSLRGKKPIIAVVNENAGIKPTVIISGKFKGEGNPFMPLTDEAKEDMQRMVDDFGASFVEAVARNRGTTVTDVKQNFGQGRVFRATEAKSIGMIDRIGTMENVIKDLMPKGRSKSRAKAELDVLTV